MGDCNSEVTETSMQEFCESQFLENILKKKICFKDPGNPACINLIIMNKPGMFQNAKTYETGLPDFHKLVVSAMKISYKKRRPRMIKCRDYKKISIKHFKNSLYEKLTNNTEQTITFLIKQF